jgi:hypothetical protein
MIPCSPTSTLLVSSDPGRANIMRANLVGLTSDLRASSATC